MASRCWFPAKLLIFTGPIVVPWQGFSSSLSGLKSKSYSWANTSSQQEDAGWRGGIEAKARLLCPQCEGLPSFVNLPTGSSQLAVAIDLASDHSFQKSRLGKLHSQNALEAIWNDPPHSQKFAPNAPDGCPTTSIGWCSNRFGSRWVDQRKSIYWVYLHSAGAVGSDAVEVEITDRLKRYALPKESKNIQ
jgi:hypothetical protein